MHNIEAVHNEDSTQHACPKGRGVQKYENIPFNENKFVLQFVPSCDPKKLEAFLIHLLLLYPLLHFFAKMRRKLDDYPLL